MRKSKILIIGSGGREHALYESIRRSPIVSRVLCLPGNGGIRKVDRRCSAVKDLSSIVLLAKREHVDFVIVGPEAPLVEGLADLLRKAGIGVFGPSRLAAELEGSKIFCKTRLDRWGIPSARFDFAGSLEVAENSIKKYGWRVIKKDGLSAGKGVIVASTEIEAIEAARVLIGDPPYGSFGEKIVMEEKLEGQEVSVMALCDGMSIKLLVPARDYKRARSGDSGLNTGGMGAYAPVSYVDENCLERIKNDIILPTLRGMELAKMPFQGLLYAGIMLTAEGPKLLEYNVRFGDPETQVVLPLMKSDIVPYLIATQTIGGLRELPPIEWHAGAAVCTVIASEGYPEDYSTGHQINILGERDAGYTFFHAGTERSPRLISSGGRVLGVVGFGVSVEVARAESLHGVSRVKFQNKYYRTDIAEGV